MHGKQDECSIPARGKDELIAELLYYDWSQLGTQTRQCLMYLLTVFLGSDDCTDAEPEKRQEIAYHVRMLFELTEKLEALEKTVKTA